MDDPANYKRFWQTLRRLGHRAIAKAPTGLEGVVDMNVENTDEFWSADLADAVHFEWKQAKKTTDAVYPILLPNAENVRNALSDYAEHYKVERIDAAMSAKVDALLAAELAAPTVPSASPRVDPA